ncbi:MAG: hypothetical protein FWK01_22245 [Pantanalinema sp. GBBB05]|nr:hypothetical protein [Pantanalinema sp. GBBB05]
MVNNTECSSSNTTVPRSHSIVAADNTENSSSNVTVPRSHSIMAADNTENSAIATYCLTTQNRLMNPS